MYLKQNSFSTRLRPEVLHLQRAALTMTIAAVTMHQAQREQ